MLIQTLSSKLSFLKKAVNSIYLIDVVDLQLVFKPCNPRLKTSKRNLRGRNLVLFHCFHLFRRHPENWHVGYLFKWFLCLFSVSKWLLHRQRRALCCEMCLRHNWVRLGGGRETEKERQSLSLRDVSRRFSKAPTYT